jgi:hypothetical protein
MTTEQGPRSRLNCARQGCTNSHLRNESGSCELRVAQHCCLIIFKRNRLVQFQVTRATSIAASRDNATSTSYYHRSQRLSTRSAPIVPQLQFWSRSYRLPVAIVRLDLVVAMRLTSETSYSKVAKSD